ncbi:hypothetical protein MPSEU_000673100 [Mayamaea pseudoterrestris]|nr:hypothetical protein MPSEU_000673100 [Mayamaea pseudoterrestris]
MEHPNLQVNNAEAVEKSHLNVKTPKIDMAQPASAQSSRDFLVAANHSSQRKIVRSKLSPSTPTTTKSRCKRLFLGLRERQPEVTSDTIDYYSINLHTMPSPPPPPASSPNSSPSKGSNNTSAASGYYLSDLLYRGRSNDEIFHVESPHDLQRKHGPKIRSAAQSSITEAQRLVDDSERFRHLQQVLRDRHCVTDALLRENIQQLLHESQCSSRYQPFINQKQQQRESSPTTTDAVSAAVEGRDEGTPKCRNKDRTTRL